MTHPLWSQVLPSLAMTCQSHGEISGDLRNGVSALTGKINIMYHYILTYSYKNSQTSSLSADIAPLYSGMYQLDLRF